MTRFSFRAAATLLCARSVWGGGGEQGGGYCSSPLRSRCARDAHTCCVCQAQCWAPRTWTEGDCQVTAHNVKPLTKMPGALSQDESLSHSSVRLLEPWPHPPHRGSDPTVAKLCCGQKASCAPTHMWPCVCPFPWLGPPPQNSTGEAEGLLDFRPKGLCRSTHWAPGKAGSAPETHAPPSPEASFHWRTDAQSVHRDSVGTWRH